MLQSICKDVLIVKMLWKKTFELALYLKSTFATRMITWYVIGFGYMDVFSSSCIWLTTVGWQEFVDNRFLIYN